MTSSGLYSVSGRTSDVPVGVGVMVGVSVGVGVGEIGVLVGMGSGVAVTARCRVGGGSVGNDVGGGPDGVHVGGMTVSVGVAVCACEASVGNAAMASNGGSWQPLSVHASSSSVILPRWDNSLTRRAPVVLLPWCRSSPTVSVSSKA